MSTVTQAVPNPLGTVQAAPVAPRDAGSRGAMSKHEGRALRVLIDKVFSMYGSELGMRQGLRCAAVRLQAAAPQPAGRAQRGLIYS